MRFAPREKAHLYTEIAKLLQAGFSLEKTLETLKHHPLCPGSRHFVCSLEAYLLRGHSISESVALIDEIKIEEVERNLVLAGERSGRLAEVFEHLSDYFERRRQTQRAITRGLLYPAVLLHLGVILFALPQAVAGDAAPAIASAVTTLLFFYAVGAATYFAYRFLHKRSLSERGTDQLLGHLPVVGQLRRTLALERFAEVFRIYIQSAFRPSEAIAAAGEASQSGYLRQEATQVSQQLVDGNDRLGSLLLSHEAFPKEFAASMSTAEEAGTLDKELDRWSKYYSESSREAFARFESWLPKIIYTCIATYIVWQIVSWYLGYFGQIANLL